MALVKKRLKSAQWFYRYGGKDIQVYDDIIEADEGTFLGAERDGKLKFEDVTTDFKKGKDETV